MKNETEKTGVIYDHTGRVDWLATRRQGVGASEVPILFGLAPASWGSPYSLWCEKTGRIDKEFDRGAEWLEIGRRMEPVICDMYASRTRREFWTGGGQFAVAIDKELPTLRATPDRWVVGAEGMPGNGVLETKNVGYYMTHNWDDGIPPHVECQLQTQLACTGYAWGSVAGILGGNTFVHRDMTRNDAFIAEVRATVADFWKYVKSDTPPPVDGSEATERALKRLHPRDSGDVVTLPAEAALWFADWHDARAAISAVKRTEEARAKEAENKFREAMGEATYGVLPDGRRMSLCTTERAGYAVDATTFRQLRLESTKTKKGR